MTNVELRARAMALVKEERERTAEIVALVAVVIEREAFWGYGFTSVFHWLREELGYSEPSAQRRLDAANLLLEVPEVKQRLATGKTNLTALGKLQTAIRAQEKLGEVMAYDKQEALEKIEGKTGLELEKALVGLFPAYGAKAKRELHRVTPEGDVRCSMNLSGDAFEKLKRVKEVLSHSLPNASDAEVIAYALEFFLEKKDPLRRPASSGAEVKGKAGLYRAVHKKFKGECCYVNPESGKKCGSKIRVEVDHITPKAKGGTDEPGNLRLLCRKHNFKEAERHFGKETMDQYRKSP